jgi:hypothetical protein
MWKAIAAFVKQTVPLALSSWSLTNPPIESDHVYGLIWQLPVDACHQILSRAAAYYIKTQVLCCGGFRCRGEQKARRGRNNCVAKIYDPKRIFH